jgi:hypothetical protein
MSKYHIEVEIWIGRGGQLRRDGDHIVYPDLAREGICAWIYRGMDAEAVRSGTSSPTQKTSASCAPGWWTACRASHPRPEARWSLVVAL